MKSVFITLLMFAVTIGAIHFKIFDIMSSVYVYVLAFVLVIVSLIFALKILGNPLTKEEKNDNEQN
jgi:hypothetical protein